MPAKIPAHVREQKINSMPNISFVRWDGGYKGSRSKAICRCAIDGYEWAGTVDKLINGGSGCPQCSGHRRWTAEERIEQINSLQNISFVRWENESKAHLAKAVCRCALDGFEWPVEVSSLLNRGRGCPQCAGRRIWTPEERIEQINALPNIRFVRWEDEYRNNRSKAVCRGELCGHEWSSTVSTLVHHGSGCPQCTEYGYKGYRRGTLYVLRSECGSVMKIGISNDHRRRHIELARATPFNWHCIELVHSNDGAFIAELEKELHGWTEPADFSEPFDGYTEWRKWDDRLPRWIKRFRLKAEAL